MDFNDTPGEAAFRAEVRSWLAAQAPAHVLVPGKALSDTEQVSRGKAWQRAKYDGGYAGITLSKTLGGRGGTIIEAVVFDEEEARYNLPKGPYIGIGLGMALPVIGKHGTEAQIARFVDRTLKGELTWCQLFSEPSAGSDLAAVRTRAVRDGEEWIVNGQKVWSSWAHQSDWGILVVRTDPSVAKHKGLTFFVIDMKSPGIEVRPIRQISGASDFNETFLTDVRIPDDCRIGAVGDGWACCMTVLMGERLNQGEEGKIASLMKYAADTPAASGTALDDTATRLALASAYAEEQAQSYLQARLRTMVSRGENPGALAAMMKLSFASRLQTSSALALEIRGAGALAIEPGDSLTRDLWEDYIWSSALRIAGGADEVLRNQIAERVLGMPGEMRADKGVPFSELK
jgi:acyl-CoA dehydrogenase